MKTILESLAKSFLILALLCMGACTGSEEPVGEEEMSASIGSEVFANSDDFDTVFGRKIPITRIKTILTIQGTNNLGKGFIFKISPYEGKGTYNFGPLSSTEHLATWINDAKDTSHFTTAFGGTTGKLVVSEDTGKMLKGTFEFTAKSSETSPVKKISFGTFKVNLQ